MERPGGVRDAVLVEVGFIGTETKTLPDWDDYICVQIVKNGQTRGARSSGDGVTRRKWKHPDT